MQRDLLGRLVPAAFPEAFPEDPVGVGARWESSVTVQVPDKMLRPLASTGMVVQTTTTYELVELAGTRGKLAVTLTSSGKSKDGKLTISEKGKGEIAFDLVKVGVGAARTEIRSEVTVDDNDMHLGQVNMKTMTVNGRAR